MDRQQQYNVYLTIQRFLSEYLFSIYMRSQAKGYEINLPYPFNLTMKECQQFANAVISLHEMQVQNSEEGLKEKNRAFSTVRNNSKNDQRNILRSHSKSTDTRREMDNKDLESTYNDNDDSTSKVVTKSKNKKSQSKEKPAPSSKPNEKSDVKKPVTIQTFIMKIYNIHKVGYNAGTFYSDDEVEHSVDVRKSQPMSNIG